MCITVGAEGLSLDAVTALKCVLQDSLLSGPGIKTFTENHHRKAHYFKPTEVMQRTATSKR